MRRCAYTPLILLLIISITTTAKVNTLRANTRRLREEATETQIERAELLDQIKLSPITLQPPEPGFQPLEIPLTLDLQQHTYTISQQYDIPMEILMAIMDHESRYIPDVPDNVNSNGTRDRGLCQINEVNWSWLQEEYGLDVADPHDNIEAAAVILSIHLEKYPLEQALACYAAGATGMARGKGYEEAAEILKAAL